MVFLALFAIPLLIAGVTFLVGKHKVTWQEFVLQLAAQAIVAGISVGVIYHNNTSDTEVWNGIVKHKAKEKVSCEHSYCCGWCESCSTDSKGNSSCHQYCCRTCYDHSYDIDWAYYTTDAGRGTISRIDRQGIKEPPRFTKVIVGEPSSSLHSYINYIKAAPDTLFALQGLKEKYQQYLPNYPLGLYDYYKINRLVLVNTNMKPEDIKHWNELISKHSAHLGFKKEVNLVIVLVTGLPQEYLHALEQHWLGGKKNDATLVIGIDNEASIVWAGVLAWTDHELFKVKTRDDILALSKVNFTNPSDLIGTFADNIGSYYIRKPMRDFEYLSGSVTPTVTQWLVSMIIGLIVAIGLSLFVYHNDIGENKWRHGSKYY